MSLPLIPTALVGSYVQPAWLVNHDKLRAMAPPRVRVREVWRVDEENLESAQDAATLVAIRELENVGLDILTDGEIRRESYSNRFHSALDGVDLDNPGYIAGRSVDRMAVPRITGPVRRLHPVEIRDTAFLRANTQRTIKMTVPGPFTLSQISVDEYYGDDEALAFAFADVLREEIDDLFGAGADIVQIDEPWLQARPENARCFGVEAINRALKDAAGTTALHMCFGYGHLVKDKPSGYSFLPELAGCTVDQVSIEAAQPNLDLSILRELPDKDIMVGVIGLGDESVETPDQVVDRLHAALEVLPPERLIAAPDCGMKYLSRKAAFGKLQALVTGAAIVRAELEA